MVGGEERERGREEDGRERGEGKGNLAGIQYNTPHELNLTHRILL